MSRSFTLSIAAVLALAGCGGGPMHVQHDAFVWKGAVPEGGWLYLRNLNGRISVASSSSGEVEISATKQWSTGSGEVRFVQHATDSGVIICTMYGSTGTCTPTEYQAATTPRNLRALGIGGGKAEVIYVVRVPAGVRVDLSTVNGGVGVADVTSAVTAETVNGSVRVATRNGPVKASTVNGSITVAIDSLAAPGDVDLSTVNGSVTAQLPATLDGALDLRTQTGRITTDFDLPDIGVRPRKHLSVTLGNGGRNVRLSTTNGNVTLSKGA
jgi:hypothetical protein